MSQPYPPPPMGQPVARSNTPTILGIIGIVVGLLCCGPAGIVLGIVSILQARKQGTAITLGIVAIVASVIGMIINGVLLANGTYNVGN